VYFFKESSNFIVVSYSSNSKVWSCLPSRDAAILLASN